MFLSIYSITKAESIFWWTNKKAYDFHLRISSEWLIDHHRMLNRIGQNPVVKIVIAILRILGFILGMIVKFLMHM